MNANETIWIFFIGFIIGLIFMGFMMNSNSDNVARDCFNGTLTTVDQEYIIHTETGKLFCYTTEWLEDNQ